MSFGQTSWYVISVIRHLWDVIWTDRYWAELLTRHSGDVIWYVISLPVSLNECNRASESHLEKTLYSGFLNAHFRPKFFQLICKLRHLKVPSRRLLLSKIASVFYRKRSSAALGFGLSYVTTRWSFPPYRSEKPAFYLWGNERRVQVWYVTPVFRCQVRSFLKTGFNKLNN